MTIEKVRKELREHIGKEAVIKYNLGRNKYEKYDVIIKETYNYVFLVEISNSKNMGVRSFSYSDVITKTIKIDY